MIAEIGEFGNFGFQFSRKMSVTELSEKVGITIANVSVLKNGKAKALKISTLIKLCEALDCQPGDILEYRKGQ
jgi:putative transcriptional regulator